MNLSKMFMRRAARVILLLAFTAAASNLHAQPAAPQQARPEMKFGHLTIEDGLSHASITAILQDRDGFLWFGTQDGLNKYNGYDLTIYKHNPKDANSLGNNWVKALHQDAPGTLWIGTENGLTRFDQYAEHFDTYLMFPAPQDPADNAIASDSFMQDRSGMLWMGTRNGRIHQFDMHARQFLRQYDLPDVSKSDYNPISAIVQDSARDNIFWVGSNKGLNKFDFATGAFTTFQPYPNGAEADDALLNRVVTLAHDAERHLLYCGGGEKGGLFVFDMAAETFTTIFHLAQNDLSSLSSDFVRILFEDSAGTMWVGTNGGGLNVFDRAAGRFERYQEEAGNPDALSSNVISIIYEDNAGTLWIGTHNLGVNMLDKKLLRFHHYKHHPNNPNSLSPNPVRAIHEGASGIIWIATDGSGLNKFDRSAGSFTHYEHDPAKPDSLPDNSVISIWEDRQGFVWLGTWSAGLIKFDPAAETFTQYVNNPDNPASIGRGNVQGVLEDHNGVIWTGARGLSKMDRATATFTTYMEDPKNPNGIGGKYVQSAAFFEDADGMIWMGFWGGGIDRFDPKTETFTHFKNDLNNPNSLSDNRVVTLYKDRGGIVWAGTPGSGLNKLNPVTGEVKRFTRENGLPSDFIYGIVEDQEGHLWISTAYGLAKMDAARETFKVYRASDGLQSDQFFWAAADMLRSGELMFGGINGLNLFDPAEITENAIVPPVCVTALKQGGEPLSLGVVPEKVTEITLDWRHNFFEFELAALNYSKPEKNQYQYFLEGMDSDWYLAGTKRYGRYSGLPDGKHAFYIKGANNDGVWNETPIALNVIITPPFWRTWWFSNLAASALLLIAVGLLFERQRRQQVRLKLLDAEHQAQLLGREMELARQIQTAILPKQLEHDELDIEAVMLPAEEVGGDYYDIVYVKNGALWLAIGDVAGHGMTPGLIMMMAQAVHATITTQMDASPKGVVVATNEILYKNVHERLRAEQHMTFTTLKYFGNGLFRHAGAHLDLIIHRRAANTCELIDTPGVYLNFVEDISEMTEEASFTLDLGDTLLLYTDGLTEAAAPDGALLPMERFLEIIRSHAEQAPAAMRDAIMQDVLAWSGGVRDDDMTLVVVRRVK